jgi:UDP-glucose 4-epimerase
MDYTVLRYANVYGPRQIPHGEAGVVAIFMDRLLSGKKCVLYRFPDEPDGMIRDYCFVGDIVKANLAALTRGSGKAFNIGTGKETRTRQLFDITFSIVKDKTGISESLSEPEPMNAREGDLTRSCLDVSRAEQELKWRAETDLATGLERTLEWRLAQ